MQVPSGMLAEKFGPRKMITIALVWWSAFTILTGMIKHHGLLYFVRFLFEWVKPQCTHRMPYLTHFGLLKMKRKSFKCSFSWVLFWTSTSTDYHNCNC